jgi:ferredoxin
MKINGKHVLLCSCEATMPLDGEAVARALGGDRAPVIHTQLCRAQIDAFRRAAAGGEPLLVACTQEAPRFLDAMEEAGSGGAIAFTNIRERSGWSDEALAATAKTAALLAEAAIDAPAGPTVTLRSGGTCLVYGRDEAAMEAARRLRGRLDPTVLLDRPDGVIPPGVADVPIMKGRIARARGHLGAFELVVDDFAPARPSSRPALAFGAPRDGASTQCDIVIDLTGGTPLFPAHARRDGYFRPDPGNAAAVERALMEAADLVGEFEKPRYVDFHAELCAHSRSKRTGCTRCLEVCPTGAIAPAGDAVAIDPFVCAGCGSCSSVCPTGAAAYDQPSASVLLERLRVLLGTFHHAGGLAPVLLVHDGRHGEEAVALLARLGRGLPADVLPFPVNETTEIGIEFLSAALAFGARRIVLLVDPAKADETSGLMGQAALAEAAMDGLGYGTGRVIVLAEADPERLGDVLHDGSADRGTAAWPPAVFLPIGTRRGNARLAFGHLHAEAPAPADIVPLPPGAPFGTLRVDTAGCTLCLSCVGACPTGALLDDADRPKLSFQEHACVQCGLCAATCPERVITLEPRLAFTPEARGQIVIKEEEPFECVRCGKPFGSRSSIERIVEKLAGRHSMFLEGAAVERIKMCDNCRVIDQFEAGAPLAAAPRPLTRTTEDYLEARRRNGG